MFEKLKQVLVDELSVNADDITMDADLVLLCEDKFDVSISDDDIHKFITVGDVVNYMEAELAK